VDKEGAEVTSAGRSLCTIVVADGKKEKRNNKKTDCKTYTHPRYLAAADA